MEEILKREPFPNCQPHLIIDDSTLGMFELAKNYDDENVRKLLRIADYTKDVFHPPMKLSQAL